MSARREESIRRAAARGVMALEHMLICRDIVKVCAPRAQAGDLEAVETIRRVARHMRMLKGE